MRYRIIRHCISILILPVNAVLVLPLAVCLFREEQTILSLHGLNLGIFGLTLSTIFILVGMGLLIFTISQFFEHGEGTLAPWDPPQKLVVEGLYRYVRNPMHSGVFLVMMGEGILLGSEIVFYSGLFFMLLHLWYIPAHEEMRLRERFGDAYEEYVRNVPRWIPRLRPWDGEHGGEDFQSSWRKHPSI